MIDINQRPIQMKLHGKDKVSTLTGGICTIIVGILLITITTFKAAKVFNRSDDRISINPFLVDYDELGEQRLREKDIIINVETNPEYPEFDNDDNPYIKIQMEMIQWQGYSSNS